VRLLESTNSPGVIARQDRYIITGLSVLFPEEVVAVVKCPDCDTDIDLDEAEIEEGELLSCPECEAELEVVQTHPIHLDVVSDEEELDDEEEEEIDEEDDETEEDEDDDDEEIEKEVDEDRGLTEDHRYE
jgi:alpha-aminoadipate carrier protein LysW